jgi:hypothetical protein
MKDAKDANETSGAAATSDPGRRARLNAVKLAALVREHLGGDSKLESSEFAGGAALQHGADAWVLLDHQPERGLGGALAWAVRRGSVRLHLVAGSGTGVLARRAEHFTLPISVWHAEGRTLLPGVPEPLSPSLDAPERHREFVDVIVAAGAVPGTEHGVLFGEVLGLEVCRVVDDAYTGDVRLEVGVGAHDREAFQMLHGDRPTAEALSQVVAAVTEHRVKGGVGHPLGRLGQERWLRARLVATPSMVGATQLRPVPPPVPRTNLKDPVPCVAIGTVDDEETLVVCSFGVDLDAVPFAVDARLAYGIDRCLLAMPSRDAVAVQHLLAAAAAPPLTIVQVDA